MKFLVDAQLPRRLGHRLRECGHDAAHTLDLLLGNRTSDAEIMRIADTEDRVVITKGNRSPPSPACGRGVGGEGRRINALPPHPNPLPHEWGRGD